MDARERSFLEEAQRQHALGCDLDAPVDVAFKRDGGVCIFGWPHGKTRLYHAATRGWCAAINWLIENGADVHVDYDVRTPLHGAVVYDRRDAAVLLLEAGARVDDRDRDGWTALNCAASQDNLNMCKLLLSRGASLDARDKFGRDPEALARLSGQTTAADFLAAVRAAGGWRSYCDAQFRDLRRELLAPGAVAESSERLYARVFVELPNAVFPRVLAFRPDF